MAWAQADCLGCPWERGLYVLGPVAVCMFLQAHSRSCTSEGNCVQNSFSLHLIGLVFLDLGSRHGDQPLISCFWQLSLCLLFIEQSRTGHVTRHIFTCCLGMWEDTQVDTQTDGERWWASVSQKLLPNSSLVLLTIRLPSSSQWQRLPVCQQSSLGGC